MYGGHKSQLDYIIASRYKGFNKFVDRLPLPVRTIDKRVTCRSALPFRATSALLRLVVPAVMKYVIAQLIEPSEYHAGRSRLGH